MDMSKPDGNAIKTADEIRQNDNEYEFYRQSAEKAKTLVDEIISSAKKAEGEEVQAHRGRPYENLQPIK